MFVEVNGAQCKPVSRTLKQLASRNGVTLGDTALIGSGSHAELRGGTVHVAVVPIVSYKTLDDVRRVIEASERRTHGGGVRAGGGRAGGGTLTILSERARGVRWAVTA
jgi:hypothetical protein